MSLESSELRDKENMIADDMTEEEIQAAVEELEAKEPDEI